jgi:diaminopimelate epimerase
LRPVRFTKMQGAGNDYVYVEALGGEATGDSIEGIPLPEVARRVSDRHFGIGGDGLVLILPSGCADFGMRMFNADGLEGEMCGNAVRCVARYVYEHGLTRGTALSVETLAGLIHLAIIEAGGRFAGVRVDLGPPRLLGKDVPTTAVGPDEPAVGFPLEIGGLVYRVTAVSMGNPHAVIFVDDVASVDLAIIGPRMEWHPVFPRRTNVEFVQIRSPREMTMRVWERGSGVTLACGTGAAAALVAAVLEGRTGREATVHLPGGDLWLEWPEDGHVYLTGPAEEVFSGEYPLRRDRV